MPMDASLRWRPTPGFMMGRCSVPPSSSRPPLISARARRMTMPSLRGHTCLTLIPRRPPRRLRGQRRLQCPARAQEARAQESAVCSTVSLSPACGCEGVGSEMWEWRSLHDALAVSHATLTSFLHSCAVWASNLASRQVFLLRTLARVVTGTVAFLVVTTPNLRALWACLVFWHLHGVATPCRNVCYGRGPAPARQFSEPRAPEGPVYEGLRMRASRSL